MIFGKQRQEAGFTMVEMLIAMAMAGIIMIAVYKSAMVQQDTYVAQDQVVAMQQNLRAATLLMPRGIRKAGYDPSSLLNARIVSATASQFTFNYDDGAGVLEETSYYLYTPADGIQKLGRALNGGAPDPVAEYIANLEFNYTMADGSQDPAPANLADIRAVQVTILAQTAQADEKINVAQSFDTPTGATWTLPVGFRGRMVSLTVECRNLGL